jgi:hypothetical protein
MKAQTKAGSGQPVVFTMRRRPWPLARATGVILESPGVGKPGAVVTDLAEDSRIGQVTQAGEAGHDLVVRMLLERLDGGSAS